METKGQQPISLFRVIENVYHNNYKFFFSSYLFFSIQCVKSFILFHFFDIPKKFDT